MKNTEELMFNFPQSDVEKASRQIANLAKMAYGSKNEVATEEAEEAEVALLENISQRLDNEEEIILSMAVEHAADDVAKELIDMVEFMACGMTLRSPEGKLFDGTLFVMPFAVMETADATFDTVCPGGKINLTDARIARPFDAIKASFKRFNLLDEEAIVHVLPYVYEFSEISQLNVCDVRRLTKNTVDCVLGDKAMSPDALAQTGWNNALDHEAGTLVVSLRCLVGLVMDPTGSFYRELTTNTEAEVLQWIATVSDEFKNMIEAQGRQAVIFPYLPTPFFDGRREGLTHYHNTLMGSQIEIIVERHAASGGDKDVFARFKIDDLENDVAEMESHLRVDFFEKVTGRPIGNAVRKIESYEQVEDVLDAVEMELEIYKVPVLDEAADCVPIKDAAQAAGEANTVDVIC